MIGLKPKPQEKLTGQNFLTRCLSILVTVVTAVNTMVTPVVAVIAEAPHCGMTEHTHMLGCYDSQSVLSCGEEESDVHTHSDECYQDVLQLTCTLPEHEHSNSCYGGLFENTAPDTESNDNSCLILISPEQKE